MKKNRIMPVVLVAVAGAVTAGVLFYNGILQLNHPSQKKYPIRGVDVSSYQGAVDWPVLSRQGIRFAFIRATEGSGTRDSRFGYNWEHAGRTALKVGAYHFFSFDSAGAAQAQNFIQTVPKREGALPPVVDIELYGDKKQNPPSKAATDRELDDLLERLSGYYGKKPILYATGQSYRLYLSGGYGEYPIWIRNVVTAPSLPDKRAWTFWQYTGRKILSGYKGQERFIDMNVYTGTQVSLEALCR